MSHMSGRSCPTGRSSCGSLDIIYSIGHSTRTIDEFIELLQAHGVNVVADIRSIPRSRRNPQFEQSALAESLRAANVEYVHFPSLGGLRRTRRDSPNSGWRNESFRGYADYMATDTFAAGLEALLELERSHGRVAMMCAEAVPWRCHRSLVADALVVRGEHVEHVVGTGTREVHRLNPMARVECGHITYPMPTATDLGLG
jgi:uncharacterized protein (DUF488 family)